MEYSTQQQLRGLYLNYFFKQQDDFWKKVLTELSFVTDKINLRTVSTAIRIENLTKDSIVVSCTDAFQKSGLEKNLGLLEKAVNKVAGCKMELEVVVRTASKSSGPNPLDLGPLFDPSKNKKISVEEKQRDAGLYPKYTFENFIVGENNRVPYSIALKVAAQPGTAYTPVFLHSGVGLGKTHLIQAIGNRIVQTKPGIKVLYTTGEAFTNELVEAIQTSKGKGGKYTSNNFRKKYRNVDVLLIDDIQFIIGKGATQEEFFHTFNTLFMAEKQIVITSDRPPKDFNNLADRLTSRFSSGMIMDIQPPTYETRVAILRTRRDRNKDDVDNKVIDFIADTISTNIRELEGAYIQVLNAATAKGVKLTVEYTAEELGKVSKQDKKPVNMNQILRAICNYYSVKTADIKGERRTKDIVVPRQIAMYLIKDLTDTPFITIGEFLGGRDHSTIMYGAEKIEKNLVNTSKIRQDITNVKQMIYQN